MRSFNYIRNSSKDIYKPNSSHTPQQGTIVANEDKILDVVLEEKVQIYAWGMESYVNDGTDTSINRRIYTTSETPNVGDTVWIKEYGSEPGIATDYPTYIVKSSISVQGDLMYSDGKIYYATNNAAAMAGGAIFVRTPTYDQ